MAKLFQPKMPEIKPPAPMPDADDPRRKAERRKEVAKEAKSSGSQANQLTAGGRETLGG